MCDRGKIGLLADESCNSNFKHIIDKMFAIPHVWFIITIALWGISLVVLSSIMMYKAESENDRKHILQNAFSIIKQLAFLLVVILLSSNVQDFMMRDDNFVALGASSTPALFTISIFIPFVIAALFLLPQILESIKRGLVWRGETSSGAVISPTSSEPQPPVSGIGPNTH